MQTIAQPWQHTAHEFSESFSLNKDKDHHKIITYIMPDKTRFKVSCDEHFGDKKYYCEEKVFFIEGDHKNYGEIPGYEFNPSPKN